MGEHWPSVNRHQCLAREPGGRHACLDNCKNHRRGRLAFWVPLHICKGNWIRNRVRRASRTYLESVTQALEMRFAIAHDDCRKERDGRDVQNVHRPEIMKQRPRTTLHWSNKKVVKHEHR